VAFFPAKQMKVTNNISTLSVQERQSAISKVIDPTFVCTAFKEPRFYLFSRREPMISAEQGRDLHNERIQQLLPVPKKSQKNLLPNKVVMFTSKGEIYLELYPQLCPKTVENFVTHAKNGYYNNMIFHRVIKGFMVQTGDPEGDGTGGESIWGAEFADELHPDLRHEEPFTLSMANCGPNTNASQFFITTVPCPWLDDKHTVFGKVTKGMNAVTDIESVRVDKDNKPLMEVKLHSIRVKESEE
jgi:peptidylprolyl isomerase domain and WD repeat-containing protein 1